MVVHSTDPNFKPYLTTLAVREQEHQTTSLLESQAAPMCREKVLISEEGPGSGASAETTSDPVEGR